MQTTSRINRGLAIEAAALGLGYASVLCWASTCLVASFGAPFTPYWPDIPWLRTDTTGIIAFVLAAAGLVVSKYLRLRRLRSGPAPRQMSERSAAVHAGQAVAETAAILATGVVAYLSVNAVTHGITLRMQLTHVLSWPSEGTVRVIALLICALSVAVTRYLRASADGEKWSRTDLSADGQGQGQVLGHDRVR
jgi:hypothetical protein